MGMEWRGLSCTQRCAKDFQELARPCLPDCVVTLYFGDTSDPCAAGLGEAHADVVLQVLKLVTDSAFTDFLQRKPVEWYQAPPK